MEIEFHDDIIANHKHRRLLKEDWDEVFLWGGRGSAKTLDLVKILVKECLELSYFNLVVVFPIENKIREGVFKDFKNFINDFGLSQFFKITESPLKILCANGNQIIFRGGQEKENAKGISEPNRMWFEECNLTPLESHDVFLTTMRSQKGKSKVYYSCNPESSKIKYKDHWVYKRFFESLVDAGQNIYNSIEQGKRLLIHSTYDDNRYCPDFLIQRINDMEITSPVKFNIWRHGRWSTKDNDLMFAHQFKMNQHVKHVQYNKDWPIHISFDQNYLPYSTATLYQTFKDGDIIRINIIDEICLEPPKNSSKAICDEFKRRYDPISVYIYGDYSGNARTQKIQETIYENHYDLIMQELAKYMTNRSKKIYPNPPRAIRGKIIYSILSEQKGYVLTIDPKCVNTINDFEQLELDENGAYKKEKKDGVEILGHTMDTFIYFLHGCFFNLFKK